MMKKNLHIKKNDYYDFHFIRRIIVLYKTLGKERKLLTETEWRNLGIKQSNGWEHYLIYEGLFHI